ncbi:MAG: DNA alkylation repair protein [Paramuribaculum sp.]|nr:DNA alkylation repair protein [Paramuribaculum sp.]
MTQFNEIQQIKRDFFALRNGVITDTLRKAGSPYKIIFGLNIPQIKEIAQRLGIRNDLAVSLWNNQSTRESMLLAPMLYAPTQFSREMAITWIDESPSTECLDILCHSLLRHTPYAFNLAINLANDTDSPLRRYAGYRILWHYINTNPDDIYSIAKQELSRPQSVASNPARQIIDEIDFLKSYD